MLRSISALASNLKLVQATSTHHHRIILHEGFETSNNVRFTARTLICLSLRMETTRQVRCTQMQPLYEASEILLPPKYDTIFVRAVASWQFNTE